MHKFGAAVLALSILAGSAMADPALPPGKPAGVAAAKGISTFWVVTTGVLLLGAGAYLISTEHSASDTISFGNAGNPVALGATSTTTTTGT